MKTDILTVFKAENCGSFLQAWALKEQLSSMGNAVRFCDYSQQFNLITNTIVGAVKCCLKLRFKRATNILKKNIDFKNFQKKLKVVDIAKDKADMYFFGSDTLWNFQDAYFKRQIPFFMGVGIKKPCYAYSISVGSTPKDVFVGCDEVVKNIQKFKKIAVRDKHSEDVVSAVYPKENIVRTIDPTLLIDKDVYIRNYAIKRDCFKKKLLIYYFGEIPKALWEEIVAFARKKDLTILNVGAYDERYDKNVVASPKNFISAFSNAEYIFTNTFHGCVFSTIFNKQFATDGVCKKKIEGFLEEFSLLGRVVKTGDDVEKVFLTPVDYDEVNKLVAEARKRSIGYLQNAIDEVKCSE